MFAIAFDPRQPKRMFCATSGGEVFASEDGGASWAERPLPAGATQSTPWVRLAARQLVRFALEAPVDL